MIRDYQEDGLTAAFRALLEEDARSALLVMPTGTGKTVLFSEGCRRWDYGRGKVMIVAHRDTLLRQAMARLHEAMEDSRSRGGPFRDYGLEAGASRMGPGLLEFCDIVIASKDSLHEGRIKKFDPMHFGLLIIDEAHRGAMRNHTYNRLYEHFRQNPRHKTLGVTATFDRTDRVQLIGAGCAFERLCYQYPLWQEGGACALTDGWLVPPVQQYVVCEGIDVDLARCKAEGGDFTNAQIERIFAGQKHLHQTALGVRRYAGTRPTFVFCATVAHADGFESDGVRHPGMAQILNDYAEKDRGQGAACVHGKMDPGERDRSLERFRSGDVQYLVSCDMLIEGVDVTRVACVAICRPTKSRSRYAQMVGRGLRPLDEIVAALNAEPSPERRRQLIAGSAKPDCLVLDFIGLHSLSLCVSLADVLAAAEPDHPAVALAKKNALQGGGGADMIAAVHEAAGHLWGQAVADSLARRAKVLASGTFSAEPMDPLGRGSSHHFRHGAPPKRPATEKQVNFLCKLGVPRALAEGYSAGQAGAVIDKLLREKGWKKAV